MMLLVPNFYSTMLVSSLQIAARETPEKDLDSQNDKLIIRNFLVLALALNIRLVFNLYV